MACDICSELAEITEAGGKALKYTAAISNISQVNVLAASTIDYFGAVDILVNNAGIMRTAIPADAWHSMLGVNVTGFFNA